MIILNIPGWKNSKAGHWQTIWEADNPRLFKRVQQKDWRFPEKDLWIRAIQKAVNQHSDKDIFITAHSIGCAAFVFAVKAFKFTVKGALLVAPSDPEQRDYPAEISGFSPVPLLSLPFPSVVVASTNDRAVSLQKAEFFAKSWGSEFIPIENAGHIDQKSGFGAWPEGLDIVRRYISA